MTRTKSQQLAHAAEGILQDAGQDLRAAAGRFVEAAGEAASAGAVGRALAISRPRSERKLLVGPGLSLCWLAWP